MEEFTYFESIVSKTGGTDEDSQSVSRSFARSFGETKCSHSRTTNKCMNLPRCTFD